MLRPSSEMPVGDDSDLITDFEDAYQPRPEAKIEQPQAPASSSTAVMLSQFDNAILTTICDYLDESFPHQKRYQCSGSLPETLLNIYERAIAHNLLWHINIDQTLEKIRAHPNCLLRVFRIKDPYGQEIEGTLLQIMKAAGDRDLREMKQGEKHFGLFESLVEIFSELGMHDECKKQDDAWPISAGTSYEICCFYEKPIADFCHRLMRNTDEMIPSDEEEVDESTFKALLESPNAKIFEEDFKQPYPHVVKSGTFSKLILFFTFSDHLSKLTKKRLVHDLFMMKFYLVLQSTLQRCDLEIMSNGLINKDPDHINFAGEGAGPGSRHSGLGATFFFGFDGTRKPIRNDYHVHAQLGHLYQLHIKKFG